MPRVSQPLELSRLAGDLPGQAGADSIQTVNIHHLELFYYAVKFGGITPAVRQMPYGIQQPAMSGQLIALEDDLGCKLFNRRPFAVTPAGQELFDFIAPFFGGLEEVEARLRGEAGRRLRIAASAPVLRDFLPELLKALEEKVGAPLKFCLRESNQRLAEDLLGRQEIDLAIVEMGGKPGVGLQYQELVALEKVLWVPAGSPIKRAAQLLKEEHPEETLVAFAMTETLTKQFVEALRRNGCYWEPGIEASSLELVATYVRQGFGVGLGIAVPGQPVPAGLRALSLKGYPPLRIGALWQGAASPLLQTFLQMAAERAAKL